MILPFKEFMKILEELVEYCNNKVKNVNVELPIEKYLKGITRKCMCGTTSLYINWNGNVYPCAFTEGKAGKTGGGAVCAGVYCADLPVHRPGTGNSQSRLRSL